MAFKIKNPYGAKSVEATSVAKAVSPAKLETGLGSRSLTSKQSETVQGGGSGRSGGSTTKPKTGADPYAKAAKKDSKLGDYVKARKSLKKGSPEWNANQNKINAAYGVKKRYEETAKPATTTTTTEKTTETKVEGKVETSKKAGKIRAKGEAVLADKNMSTEDKQRKALKLRKKYDKQNAKVKKKGEVNTAKASLKETKKENKIEKIESKADVATAKGKTKKASRLKAKAEREETGKSKKDQGRNIFGRKTKKQKAKEAAAAATKKDDSKEVVTLAKYKTVAKKCACGKAKCNCK